MGQAWISQFKGLNALPDELRTELVAGSKILMLPKGTTAFSPGQISEHLLLLLSGTIRVHQESPTGRDVTLYRVNAGESCVLTTACMLAFKDYSATGVAETDSSAAAIPRKLFDDLIAKSAPFREFVFTAYARRMTDLFVLIDDIAFQRMDVRLAARLISLSNGNAYVKATHNSLATELGTAREVVSRVLGEFQRRDWIKQKRGQIDLTRTDALRRLADTGEL